MRGHTSQEYRRVALKPDTFEKLRAFGAYGDTADTIVSRLIESTAYKPVHGAEKDTTEMHPNSELRCAAPIEDKKT